MMLVLETDRLMLRTWMLDDSKAALQIWGNAKVMQYVGKPFENVEAARQALENAIAAQNKYGVCLWAVVEKRSGRVVGCCGFHPFENDLELAYHFIPQVWGKGYATEAAQACLSYGFGKLNTAKIVAFTHPDNIPSYRVLEKLGMKYKGLVEIEGSEEKKYELNRTGHNKSKQRRRQPVLS
jgi:[ribosomal protein S5]-alanine N-acetyltransferase